MIAVVQPVPDGQSLLSIADRLEDIVQADTRSVNPQLTALPVAGNKYKYAIKCPRPMIDRGLMKANTDIAECHILRWHRMTLPRFAVTETSPINRKTVTTTAPQ